MRFLATALPFCWLLLPSNPAFTSDWPTWRHDVSRSGTTAASLSLPLTLHWMRHLPPPRPAWPASQHKLQFDASYEPVVADRRMFVGSTVNDSVTAYDAETGRRIWRYYTDGPVRFAPAVSDERVFAVSDDGFLYCLSAGNGELIWRVNGAPAHRPIIGNGRLISTWPARGGVVVDDGVAYFAAGIWPSMGVFVHAVDAESGQVLWTNSETSGLFITHPHGADSFGAISPHGYLALSGDALLVAGGRTLPAAFDRRTGRLNHFHFGGKGGGGYDPIATDRFFFVGNEMFRTEDGASLAQMFVSLISPQGEALGTDGASVVVSSLAGRTQETTSTDRRGNPETRTSFEPQSVRRFVPDQPGRVLLQMGRHVVLGSEHRVAAFDLPAALEQRGEVAPVWSAVVEGTPTTILSADRKLFVVTDQSKIYCFAAGSNDVIRHEWEVADAPVKATIPDAPIGDLLQHLGGTARGFALVLGLRSPDSVRVLIDQFAYHVVGLDADADTVTSLRQQLDAAGVYGVRAALHVSDPLDFNFPPYLASLIVVENPRITTVRDLRTVFEPLRPYGGAALLRVDHAGDAQLRDLAEQADLHGVEFSRDGGWTVMRRVGPLPGAADWTHQYADASNTVVSQDSRVKAPLGVLWFGGSSNDKVLPRHGHGPSPQVAGGRLFIEGPDMLRAVDVYTGQVWWEREFPGLGKFYDNTSHQPGAGEIGSNYVSLADHVYVVYGAEILELDAATGETTRKLSLSQSDGRTDPRWGTIFVADGLLIATANPVAVPGMEARVKASIPSGHESVIAPHATWSYLAGSDPPPDWATPEFDVGHWKTGPAGFGYGDRDDRTVLEEMEDRYQRVYLRTTFDRHLTEGADQLTLAVNFDDAFIAYVNGREVLRTSLKGRGANARDVGSHEAEGYESFEIPLTDGLLRPGNNVLALEGHNSSLGSSDFSLDPYVLVRAAGSTETPKPKLVKLVNRLLPAEYSSASRKLVVFNRHTGEQLWSRDAEFNFRHNAVCVGDGRIFCIDGMSPAKLDQLSRRGAEPSDEPRLLALDGQTGNLVWETDQNVFGTFLNYSAEHDVLVQAGSAYRDRARDEVDRGMVAYRGDDGTELWTEPDLQYGGPCLLWRDKIITNGGGGFALELLTGEPTGWKYQRMYGCNTAIGSENLLTFRSGAAGFFDLAGNSGTGNLGGFRSSCTSNLIPADGVLNAPDFTRTCSCAYQLQTSLAFVHDPDVEMWTFNPPDALRTASQSTGINLGAPGDRGDGEGVLWLEFPVTGGPSPDLNLTLQPSDVEWFTRHSSLLEGELRWVGASGARGIRELRWRLGDELAAKSATVRLIFSEPDHAAPGERVFNVFLEGKEVLHEFDIARESRGAAGVIVKDFTSIHLDSVLDIRLTPSETAQLAEPVLCGVAVMTEK